MKIEKTNKFNIVQIIDKPNATPSILLENSDSKERVEVLGKTLEAQYCVDNDYLLFVTEGNPFEEALYIYYLSSDLRIKDFLELSAMYAGGMVRNLKTDGINSVNFSFFEQSDEWVLTVLPSPRYTIRGNRFPVKRKLPMFRKGWLKLERA